MQTVSRCTYFESSSLFIYAVNPAYPYSCIHIHQPATFIWCQLSLYSSSFIIIDHLSVLMSKVPTLLQMWHVVRNKQRVSCSVCFLRSRRVCLQSMCSGWNLHRPGRWLRVCLPFASGRKDLPDR